MAQNIMFCFANTSAEILLHALGFIFLHRAAYFVTHLPSTVAIKSIKNYLRKSCSALVPKMFMKLSLLLCDKLFKWKHNLNEVISSLPFKFFYQIKLKQVTWNKSSLLLKLDLPNTQTLQLN